MATTNKTVIRLSKTKEMCRALEAAKKMYPTLSDAEILKLGLSKIVPEDIAPPFNGEHKQIRLGAAYALGHAYLQDDEEDIYTADMGKKVSFS